MKKMLKKKSIVIPAILSMILVIWLFFYFGMIAGVEEVSDGLVRIYYVDNISPVHQKLIDQFNRMYAGKIEVVPINLPFEKFSTNERKELLARSLRSRNPRIDIFSVDVIWVQRFAQWAEPLDMILPTNERRDLLPEALESCISNGKLMAVPLYLDVGLMYYRKDLIKNWADGDSLIKKIEESLTWDELLRLQNRLKEGQPLFLFPAKAFEGLVCMYTELMYSQNANLFEEHGDSLEFYTKEAIQASRLLWDLIYRYRVTPQEVTGLDEVGIYHLALERDALFFRGWPGFIPQFHSDKPLKDIIGLAPIPRFANGKSSAVFGGWDLMISRYSHHKREASVFLKFLLHPEHQKLLYTEGGYIPVNKNVFMDSSLVESNPELRFYSQQILRGRHRPSRKDYTMISDILSEHLHKALKMKMSPEAALQEVSRKINVRNQWLSYEPGP